MTIFDYIAVITAIVCLDILINVLRILRRLTQIEQRIDRLTDVTNGNGHILKRELDEIRRILSEKNPDSKK